METALERLTDSFPSLSPQLRKAAQYVLDNPNAVGVGSIYEIAEAAEVKPNTLVRMARAVGFEGYEDFREPFRTALREGGQTFPDRARWLQSIARGGRHGRILADLAESTLSNAEDLFSNIATEQVKQVADLIVNARVTYVLGVGVSYALAHNFAYLARMAFDNVVAVPRYGNLPQDDIAKAGPHDVLIALTFRPYRTEVIEAVSSAREQHVNVVAITDSRSSPIALAADHAFIVGTETPQFFTSTVAASALLESIMAFVIAEAGPDAIAAIDRFHRRREELGIYWTEET